VLLGHSYYGETRLMNYNEGAIRDTEFFTTAELAKKLKMNVQVITRKVQAGEIEAFKIGKDWRIPERAVFEWLERNSNRRQKDGQEKKARVVTRFVKNERIEALPSKRFERKYLLEYILAQFEPNRDYSEDEVNRLIARYYDDFATVRREFVAENMMDRDNGSYRRRLDYKLLD
jgi:excisionase family DNA binding protein